MRLQFPTDPEPKIDTLPEVGDLLAAKGGSPTVAWLCVAMRETKGVYLGVDSDGNVISGATYNHHAMRHRSRLGKVDIPDLLKVVRP